MVFGGDVGSDGVGGSQESFHVNFVGDVSVKVILEVLKHIHVVVDEIVSSDSWEGESLVVKLPCVDLQSLWVLQFSGDVSGVFPVSWIKGS